MAAASGKQQWHHREGDKEHRESKAVYALIYGNASSPVSTVAG
jgi:hypothetical protein